MSCQIVDTATGKAIITVINMQEGLYWADCHMCGKFRRLDHSVAWYCGPTHDEIGSVTARDEAGDRCPNDNKPLWRVSWKEHAAEMAQRAEAEICRSRRLEKVLGRIAGGEYDYLKDAMSGARAALSPADGAKSNG